MNSFRTLIFTRPKRPASWRKHLVTALAAGLVALAYVNAEAAAGQPEKGAADAGKAIAQAGLPQAGTPACMSCHGAEGEGVSAFPRLAGAGEGYLLTQLNAFASGKRQNAIMQPYAKSMNAEQRQSVARYYASLPAPDTHAAPEATTNQEGAWLAQRGNWDNNIPACAQCHGPAGLGVGEHFPPLAALPASYMVEQLTAFTKGTRPGGPQNLMGTIAGRLSTAQMEAVAKYYESLAGAGSPKQADATTSLANTAKRGAQ